MDTIKNCPRIKGWGIIYIFETHEGHFVKGKNYFGHIFMFIRMN